MKYYSPPWKLSKSIITLLEQYALIFLHPANKPDTIHTEIINNAVDILLNYID